MSGSSIQHKSENFDQDDDFITDGRYVLFCMVSRVKFCIIAKICWLNFKVIGVCKADCQESEAVKQK